MELDLDALREQIAETNFILVNQDEFESVIRELSVLINIPARTFLERQYTILASHLLTLIHKLLKATAAPT